jgi:hypothetical protein
LSIFKCQNFCCLPCSVSHALKLDTFEDGLWCSIWWVCSRYRCCGYVSVVAESGDLDMVIILYMHVVVLKTSTSDNFVFIDGQIICCVLLYKDYGKQLQSFRIMSYLCLKNRRSILYGKSRRVALWLEGKTFGSRLIDPIVEIEVG